MSSALEDELFPRPPPERIQSKWKSLFSDPLLSLSRLRAAALSKDGLGESDVDGGIALRSVYWRLYFGLLPPPTSPELFSAALSSSRLSYTRLRERFLVAPDGRWADDCSGGDEYTTSTSQTARSVRPSSSSGARGGGGGESAFDPLSLDENSPWKAWYAHLELRKVIMQDVDRTFPDLIYFTLERVKRSMVTMLFLFSVMNPDVGYRQGIHELLAVCLLTVDRDSLAEAGKGTGDKKVEAMYDTLDRRYVEHDAFEIFTAIMKPAKAFYEWKQEEGPRTKGPNVQAPIIIRSNNLHSSLIRRIDPQMWEKLENEGIEAQLWAMRWYKLIFTRELPFALALRLWDGIFAEDPTLGILDFICMAMLLLIRNELLDSDHSGLLTSLLRYPSPSPLYPFSPFLILSQALLLRNSINPTTGVEVVIQNHEVLGVSAQPPLREPVPVRPPPRAPPRGVQGLAAGLFERAQAAGLDRAILSTVADIRRNIPDSAYSYLNNLPFSPSQSPASKEASGSFSTIPSLSALPRHQPPPLQPTASTDTLASTKTLRDAERELAELRLAMVGMGKAMSEWVSSLPESTGTVELNGLGRVRDTLLDAAGKEVEEIVREWGWHEGLETPSSREPTPAPSETALSMEPDDIPLEKEKERAKTGEELTPKPASVNTFQPSPLPSPVPRSAPAVPKQLDLTGIRDQPSTGLPRTPMTAPIRDLTAKPFQGSMDGRTRGFATQRLEQKEEGDINGDPLAGLGVGIQAVNGRRRVISPSGGTGGKTVDPLLGMGLK